VFLAKHKQEDKVYAVKVLTKAAIRKRNEVLYMPENITSLFKEVEGVYLKNVTLS
jgi:hypothetical protein